MVTFANNKVLDATGSLTRSYDWERSGECRECTVIPHLGVPRCEPEQSSDTVADSSTTSEPLSFYDVFERAGLIGCIKDAPLDLSTNPKYLEGFGDSGQ